MSPFWGSWKPAEFKFGVDTLNDNNVRKDELCSGEKL